MNKSVYKKVPINCWRHGRENMILVFWDIVHEHLTYNFPRLFSPDHPVSKTDLIDQIHHISECTPHHYIFIVAYKRVPNLARGFNLVISWLIMIYIFNTGTKYRMTKQRLVIRILME